MFKVEKFVEKVDDHKGFIWGGFLASAIAGFAVSNIYIGLLGVCFLSQLIYKKSFRFLRDYTPVILYFFWGVMSLWWTTNLNNTADGINKSIYLLLIPLFVSQFSSFNLKDLKALVRTLGSFLLIYFFISIVNSYVLYLNDSDIKHFFYHSLTIIFNNNAIYISLLCSICILLLTVLPSRTKFDFGMLAVLVLYLLLLSSKNLILSTFLMALVILILQNRKSLHLRKSLIVLFCIIAVCMAAIIIDSPVRQRFLGEFQFNFQDIWYGVDFTEYPFTGTSIRIFQWRVIWEMIGNGHIGWLGLGWNNVNYLLYQYFGYYNFYEGYFSINFHNQYLQSLGELGFVGLLILFFTILKSIYSGIRNNFYLLAFIMVISFSFLTESLLSRQKGVIIFIVFYCVLNNLKSTKSLAAKKEK